MPYIVCVSKLSPCCTLPFEGGGAAPFCARSLEVYGCSPDLTAGEKSCCCQGNTTPAGCCCAFTVPAGVTQITVELWGGGGGGGSGYGAECCGQNPGAGAGSWVQRTFTVAPNDILTLCAGAGGCHGGGTDSGQQNFCCCGQQGQCSFVQRNGNMCVDSGGGRFGPSVCYYHCGCMHRSCGSCYGVSDSPTGDCGANQGCTGYTSNLRSAPTSSVTPGCGGNCSNQASYGGSAPWGGDGTWNNHICNCHGFIRFNTSCTNSLGVAGIGGDPGPASTAYNLVGTPQYVCSTSSFVSCERPYPTAPGNFPGGGGSSGHSTSCCNQKTSGGIGAPGYIRVWY